jgi:hypothetical protein
MSTYPIPGLHVDKPDETMLPLEPGFLLDQNNERVKRIRGDANGAPIQNSRCTKKYKRLWTW